MRLEKFFPFKEYINFPNTRMFWRSFGVCAKPVKFIGKNREAIEIPYYNFGHNTPDLQTQAVYKLSQATVNDGRELIFEIGPGESFSPLTIASGKANRTVIAFDPLHSPRDQYRYGTVDTELPTENSHSFAAYFKTNPNHLDPLQIAQAEHLFAFSPYPTALNNFIQLGAKLSRYSLVVPNPDQNVTSNLELSALPPEYRIQITKMKTKDIETFTGKVLSAFITGRYRKEDKIKVIEIKKID